MSAINNILEPLRHMVVPLDGLQLDPANARKHDSRSLEAIRFSIERFGFREPIVVQKQGMVVRAGNGRVTVLRNLGWTEVPAVVVDEEDADAAAFAIADNRAAEFGEWDYAKLNELLESFEENPLELGFNEDELAAIQADMLADDGVSVAELLEDLPATEEQTVKLAAPPSAPDKEREAAAAAGVVTVGGDGSMADSDSAGVEAQKMIRRVTLYMSQAQYDRSVQLFTLACKDLDVESHSDAVIGMLEKLYGN